MGKLTTGQSAEDKQGGVLSHNKGIYTAPHPQRLRDHRGNSDGGKNKSHRLRMIDMKLCLLIVIGLLGPPNSQQLWSPA